MMKAQSDAVDLDIAPELVGIDLVLGDLLYLGDDGCRPASVGGSAPILLFLIIAIFFSVISRGGCSAKSEKAILPEETEKILGEWLEFEVPYLFNKGMLEHRDKFKIVTVMAMKAASLHPPITTKKLEIWFSSIRT